MTNIDVQSDNIFNSEEDQCYHIAEEYCKMITPIGISNTGSIVKRFMVKASFSGYMVISFVLKSLQSYIYRGMFPDLIISSEPANLLSYALFILFVLKIELDDSSFLSRLQSLEEQSSFLETFEQRISS